MRIDWREIESPIITAEQCAVRLFEAARTKSSRRNLDFDLRFETVMAKVSAGRCEATGIPFDMRAKPQSGPDLPFRASLDRINNLRGYHDDNVQVVCKMYNSAKFSWGDEDVMIMAVALVNHQVGLILAKR